MMSLEDLGLGPEDFRDKALFTGKVIPVLQSNTGLSPKELSELLVDFSLENLLPLLGRALAPYLELDQNEVEEEFLNAFTEEEGATPESIARSLILKAGKNPEPVLKTIDFESFLMRARQKAVLDIIDEFSAEETQEALDPHVRARKKFISDLRARRAQAERDYSARKAQDYLSPEEKAREKELQTQVDKKGGEASFQKWVDLNYPQVDWDALEKKSDEEEAKRNRDSWNLLAKFADKQLDAREKEDEDAYADELEKQGASPSSPRSIDTEEEPEISDADIEEFLKQNKDWAQAVKDDPTLKDTLRANPELMMPDMAEGVDLQQLSPEDQRKLTRLGQRVKAGGINLPQQFISWKYMQDKGVNPNLSVDDFIRSFFTDPETTSIEDLLAYGNEKPLSKRRMAELLGLSAQTLTTGSKKIKLAQNIQDPEAVRRFLQPRRADKNTGQYGSTPDWLVDALEPLLVTSNDFVSDVSDLTERLLNWEKDPKIRSMIEDDLERARAKGKQIDVTWDLDDPGRALKTALTIVAKKKSVQIAKDLMEAIDTALANLDEFLSSASDEETSDIRMLVGEGPLDWRAALKRFYDPEVDQVLASEGLSYILGGNSVVQFKNEIRPVVQKIIRSSEGDQGSLNPGQRLFTALERAVYDLVTSKEMYQSLSGDTREKTHPMYMVKPGLHKAITKSPDEAENESFLHVESRKGDLSDSQEKKEKSLFAGKGNSVRISKSDIRGTQQLFKSKLSQLGSNPTVADLKDWMRGVPKTGKQGKASAKDLVRLLSFLWG